MNTQDLLQTSLEFKDKLHDLDNALKYAYFAAASTYSPKADVCCHIGEIYLEKGNVEWSRFWYEKALNNISMDINEISSDIDYYTIIPLLKLCFICFKCKEYEQAKNYNDSVLKIDSKNTIALKNKEELEKIINNK